MEPVPYLMEYDFCFEIAGFVWCLNEATDGRVLVSSGSEFHKVMVDGTNDFFPK